MTQKIAVDLLEQIAETQAKIDRFQSLIHHVKEQNNVLEDFKKNNVPLTDKFELHLGGILGCSLNISGETLIPILEQNIEDNTIIIHELAKELGIEVK